MYTHIKISFLGGIPDTDVDTPDVLAAIGEIRKIDPEFWPQVVDIHIKPNMEGDMPAPPEVGTTIEVPVTELSSST